MLTKRQFDVLVLLEANRQNKYSQRRLALDAHMSVGLVNKVMNELKQMQYIDENIKITNKGLRVLEPYRVKRAIFLAAGFGSRLVPITLNTPKPLVRVHGVRIIETLLDAVVEAGISDIIIVRGYLKEQFELLLHKYPQIRFVDNEQYNEANNISSAYMVRDLLENAYVLESDLVLSNPKLIRKYEYTSNFLGVFVDRSDDWCFDVKNNIIVRQKVGGVSCYQMVGISYYNKEDGKKLNQDIADVFLSPGGKEKYWEQVQLVERKDHYKICIRECKMGDVIEIDTFNELKRVDQVYDI